MIFHNIILPTRQSLDNLSRTCDHTPAVCRNYDYRMIKHDFRRKTNNDRKKSWLRRWSRRCTRSCNRPVAGADFVKYHVCLIFTTGFSGEAQIIILTPHTNNYFQPSCNLGHPFLSVIEGKLGPESGLISSSTRAA